jgi:hypothetical protein
VLCAFVEVTAMKQITIVKSAVFIGAVLMIKGMTKKSRSQKRKRDLK